jgi:glutathione synthase/RimK-type ligase-like ATP-grasp enzyme
VRRPGVLIVAPGADLHARGVHRELQRRNADVEWVDFAELDQHISLTESIDGTGGEARLKIGDGRCIALSEVDTIWWRRPRPPVAPEGLDEVARSFVAQEWRHFLEGLEAVTASRWVNPPDANRRAERTSVGLMAAVEAGLRVPRTAITNDPTAVGELAARGDPLIYKRIGASRPAMATMPLKEKDLDRLESLPNCPAVFQERIEARMDIRVTAIGSELHVAEIESQAGDGALDWRLDHSVPFRPHRLEADVADRLRDVIDRLGLAYGAIDLRLTPAGEYVFLEVNPSGQFLFVELLTGMSLTAHLADFLARTRGGS